ncbi:uncharacterized protein DUF349 [Collimonas sp. PA-H2]|uniref:DUF349 domain-containing protein n=1 Tax=Collimonas sp. PA-H2 TaxID=1881062 RepID=UPI000BF444F3|nr:DUF349 domain-containing protein [Collimonas sp. PA-H2]PFH11309.1 uncharacterized protein DUF349 [Collimonas sp. PA-H2]
MFGFLFKRTERAAPQPAVAPQAALRAEAKQVSDQARQQALQQAQALSDEAAALAFILQSTFADARLAAAQLVQSPPALEQVLQACRNTDRRVAKLMQARLDSVRQQQAIAGKAAACIAQAQRLQQERQLMPNQVAELDRSWEGKDVPSDLQQQFTQLRAALAERLSAQAVLQHDAIGLLNQVRAMHLQAKTGLTDTSPAALDVLEAQMASCVSHSEALTLPRHLASDFAQEAQALRKLLQDLQQHQAALQARNELLSNWEAATDTLQPEALKSAWSALPRLPAALLDDGLEQRYQGLLKQHAPVIPQKTRPEATAAESGERPPIAEALDGLEKALEDGALQHAVDFDKALRAMDFKQHKPSATQAGRLAQARSELTRLQGWARWGGNVSREELTKAALELPAQELAPAELAKKIGSLRARWKSLDVSSGSAPKALWEGFDAACTAAYAPVAAHFQQQAEQRQANQVNARALIDEVQQYAQSALATDAAGAAPDWKIIAQFCQQKQQAWKTLGPINRSEKKSLDSAFTAALQSLQGPLAEQQAIEVGRREKLITEAAQLPANQRDTADRVKELQARWQEQAKALPLPRQEEQELWLRFRSACDAIFAQRKEAASSADAERRDNLRLREEQCAALEAAVAEPAAGLAKILQQAQQDWNRGGQVPRAAEAQIDARFQAAVAAAQAILEQSRRQAALAQADALRGKLALCQKIETAIAASGANESRSESDWRGEWQALPALAPAFEKIIAARFERAVQNGSGYAARLEAGRPLLQQELLRAEIMAGCDSPPALSRERLQLQVEVLQASLKAGGAAKNIEQQLLHICDLPAVMDDAALLRLLKLVALAKA